MGRILILLLLVCRSYGRKRYFNMQNEGESVFHISTFAYLAGGQLSINVTDTSTTGSEGYMFVLEKDERGTAMKETESKEAVCKFPSSEEHGQVVVYFHKTKDSGVWKGTSYQKSLLIKNGTLPYCVPNGDAVTEEVEYVPFQSPPSNVSNVMFTVCFSSPKDEGQYSLYLRTCEQDAKLSFQIAVVEQNPGPNYLPSGEMALPALYAFLSIIFGGAALFWIIFLCRHEATVFKIHYLMFVLILLKTLAVMFHSMDYYFISMEGSPMQTFAVLFYITYLIKGALLFSILALVGSGWAFIKPILSDKEKKIFLLVIPLQIFANVAYIITDVSEEGDNQYMHWRAMFIVVDILCCVAIIFPIKWSVKFLQTSSQTDGKAALSLRKLHLFQKYYIMVVAYFYLTRIFSLILKVILTPSFSWIHELFFEATTLAFFMITAYSFRPGADNPYLQLPIDDDEFDLIEIDEITTQSGHNNTQHRGNHEKNHVANHQGNHVTNHQMNHVTNHLTNHVP